MKRIKLTLALYDPLQGNSRKEVTVPAYLPWAESPFAIHVEREFRMDKPPEVKRGRWIVTHIETGCAMPLRVALDKNDAVWVAFALAHWPDADWTKPMRSIVARKSKTAEAFRAVTAAVELGDHRRLTAAAWLQSQNLMTWVDRFGHGGI